ncbi:hypothetical protein H072_10402 [Dactylellina haptotyla CBS 200.50]|uniref:Actin-related protein 2/3 complex subunit 5 n=1 Tax=Dactylellina haptotyla (strain CBS 200.50) TaxID=1284197 RepID=S8A021_DACHA|nr:hypothetical protein H072_10402 [Dactylellina haptotyla CBS 200.50]
MAANQNWRLIDVDALDPELTYPAELLSPPFEPVPTSAIQQLGQQCRGLVQRGESSEALRIALESVPYGADEAGKDLHCSTVVEILGSIKQSEMSATLNTIYSSSEAGSELLDTLMKYLYKGMAKKDPSQSGTGGASSGMSVLLSWHEKVVEIAGLGSIVRVMTDRRTV